MGIDFAYTLMNPLTMHHSQVIPEMYRRLGRGEEGPERLAKWYKLRDSLGNPGDRPDQRVRVLKEYNRGRLNSEVFGNDPEAIRLYAEMELTERKPPEGVREALVRLRTKGKTLAVVSEVSSVEGTLTVVAFLRAHGIVDVFNEVITPAGLFTAQGKMVDGTAFAGSNKKEGTLYERLATYLASKGIGPGERAMIGDDPKLDVEFSRKRGFVGVLYKGIVDRGETGGADLVANDWNIIARSA